MLRYLNMFVLIAIALFIIGIAGLATNGKFLMEAGQEPGPNASLIYLGAGVLMLINGIISVRNAPPQPVKPKVQKADESADATTARS